MLLYLHDQNDRISDENTDECQHPKDRHEAKWLATWKQCCNHANQTQRSHCHHEEQPLEALQLQHQHCCHDEQHQWHHSRNRPLTLATFLNCASRYNGIASGELIDERLHRRFKFFDDSIRHRFINDTSSNRYRWNARTAINHRLLKLVAEIGNSCQRYRTAVASRNLQALQCVDGIAFMLLRANNDIDEIN